MIDYIMARSGEVDNRTLETLIAFQDCLDTQLCRSLNRGELDCTEKKAKCNVQIPNNSPFKKFAGCTSQKTSTQVLASETVENILGELDQKILEQRRNTKK